MAGHHRCKVTHYMQELPPAKPPNVGHSLVCSSRLVSMSWRRRRSRFSPVASTGERRKTRSNPSSVINSAGVLSTRRNLALAKLLESNQRIRHSLKLAHWKNLSRACLVQETFLVQENEEQMAAGRQRVLAALTQHNRYRACLLLYMSYT